MEFVTSPLMLARSFLLIFCVFITSISAAQGTVQLWKVYYDSGNNYLKSDALRAAQLFAKAESIAKNDLGIYHENYLAIIGALGLSNENARNYDQAQKYLAQTVLLGKEVYLQDT